MCIIADRNNLLGDTVGEIGEETVVNNVMLFL
jgi:hypothetical protein